MQIRVHIHMGTKTISITDEAYDFLKKMKGDKSFSEVILSLKADKKDIMKYAGALKDADLDSIRKKRREARKEWSER